MSSPDHESSPPPSGPDFNESDTTGQKSRAPRKPNLRPRGRYHITALAKSGAPSEPKGHAAKWRTTCGFVARQNVSIAKESWRKLNDDERQTLLEDIHTHFTIPEEMKARVESAALKVANKRWKDFKSMLHREYVLKDISPLQKYPCISKEDWVAFKEYTQTEEFKAKSEAAKENASKNTHHHRLGSAGYAGKERMWREEEDRARLSDQPIPFPGIDSERARNWLLARRNPAATSSNAESFTTEATQEVYSKMQQLCTQSSRSEFQRERDALTQAIGTKEHPGRTRGQGVYTTWKDAFPDDLHMYRKRFLTKAERQARKEAAITDKITHKLESQMQSQIAEQVASQVQRALQLMIGTQGQAGDIQLLGSPVGTRKSSQASVPDVFSAAKLPVDDILESTPCKLLLRLVDDVPLEAATGMAYPCNEGDILHGTPMERGNTKVTVDNVHDFFKSIPLKFPPNDEVAMLGQAEGTFIQWPKRDVLLSDRRPPSFHGVEPRDDARTALPEPEPSVEPRDDAQTALPEPEPIVAAEVECHAQSYPQVSPNLPAPKRKRGRPSKAKSLEARTPKYKDDLQVFIDEDLPYAPLADKYQLGQPWIKDRKRMREIEVANGYAHRLHGYYLRECAKPLDQRTTSIQVQFTEDVFHHMVEDCQFYVDFLDLWEMYNLRSLEVSILRCFTL